MFTGAMLLVEYLQQPESLIVSGNAGACESRLHVDASRRMPRRQTAAVLSRWPEPVFQV